MRIREIIPQIIIKIPIPNNVEEIGKDYDSGPKAFNSNNFSKPERIKIYEMQFQVR